MQHCAVFAIRVSQDEVLSVRIRDYVKGRIRGVLHPKFDDVVIVIFKTHVDVDSLRRGLQLVIFLVSIDFGASLAKGLHGSLEEGAAASNNITVI